MTIEQLYETCENLSHVSTFHIFTGVNFVGEFYFLDIPAKLCTLPVKGFKIIQDNHIIVYV